MRIVREGKTLELMTDAFGVGGLYFRELDDLVLFATNPRFLTLPGDKADHSCWLTRVSYGCLFGERHLNQDIRRAPPGSILTFERSGRSTRQWFSFDSLPEPVDPINDHGLEKLECVFRQAVRRCLRLPRQATTLPLTSGHDSRRILAELVDVQEPLQALTVRVPQKQNRDLDAPFAKLLAAMDGIEHETIELPPIGRVSEFDRVRRLLLDGESPWHLWALPMAIRLPEMTSLVFDGLGGDVLGETGFEEPSMFTASDRGVDSIARTLVNDALMPVMDWTEWVDPEAVRVEVREWLMDLPAHQRPDLAFLLSRTVRSAALWSQRLVPSGHVTVYPYFDLDYVFEAMRFDPLARIRQSLQDRCLRRFRPVYHAIPGSRNIPPWLLPGSPRLLEDRDLACIRSMWQDLAGVGAEGDLLHLLSGGYRLAARGAQISRFMAVRSRWWLEPILALVHRQRFAPNVWGSELKDKKYVERRVSAQKAK